MVIAAVGTVLAAGYLLWMFQRVALGKPKPEFERRPHPRRARAGVDRLDAAAAAHRGARLYPQLLFKMTDLPRRPHLVNGLSRAL